MKKHQEPEIQDIEIGDLNNHEKELWVDLYKPRQYLELLSDESTNRTLLRWLKLWDKIVFKKKPKIKVLPVVEDNKKKKFFKFNELNTNLDEHGRPEHKVVLLCGPPGLGMHLFFIQNLSKSNSWKCAILRFNI